MALGVALESPAFVEDENARGRQYLEDRKPSAELRKTVLDEGCWPPKHEAPDVVTMLPHPVAPLKIPRKSVALLNFRVAPRYRERCSPGEEGMVPGTIDIAELDLVPKYTTVSRDGPPSCTDLCQYTRLGAVTEDEDDLQYLHGKVEHSAVLLHAGEVEP